MSMLALTCVVGLSVGLFPLVHVVPDTRAATYHGGRIVNCYKAANTAICESANTTPCNQTVCPWNLQRQDVYCPQDTTTETQNSLTYMECGSPPPGGAGHKDCGSDNNPLNWTKCIARYACT